MKDSHILKELKDVLLIIEKYEKTGELPEIEKGIVITKLQQIYDELLHTFSHSPYKPDENKKISFDKAADNVVNQINDIKKISKPDNITAHDIIKEKVPEILPEENIKVTDELSTNDDLIQIEDKSVEIKESEQKKEIHHKHKAHTEKEILADKFGKNQAFINETLAREVHKKDVSSLMQSKPIRDIEAAIGVNEKYLIVRELFNGDTDSYLNTIRILNNSANFNEAFNYIHINFNWNLESEAAQKLLDLVRRRFIVEDE